MTNDIDMNDGTEKRPPKGQEAKFFEALWGLFSSMRTAIVLLLLLATVSILGTIIPQNAMPMEQYEKAYGPIKFSLIKLFGLTNLFHSGWYSLLLVLVGANLIVCSINRFSNTLKQIQKPLVSTPANQVSRMQKSEKLSTNGSIEAALEKTTAALKSVGYQVRNEKDGSETSIYATKGWLSLWGPYLTHLSILVIFVGAVIGGMTGFNGYTTITEGQSTSTYERESVGEHNHGENKINLGFRVALGKFRIDHDKSHNPTGYRSELKVYDGDKLVAQKEIDVNHPLTYRGISFFQSSYGLTGVVLKVTAPNGEFVEVPFPIETGSGMQGPQYSVGGEPFKTVSLNGKKFTIFAHNVVPDYVESDQVSLSSLPINPAVNVMVNDRFPEYKGLDAWAKLGWLQSSKPVMYKGFKISLDRAVNYTGLQVSQNPGLPLIYTGFGLLLLGLFMSFYITLRIIRVRITPAKNGVDITIGATSRSDITIFDRDIDRLKDTFMV
ncbi:MAG: cytochrome c biogenesis protein ResB [Armatimonadota bacterium]